MRSLVEIVACPVCGRSSKITLIENVAADATTDGHVIDFDCPSGLHELSEQRKLRLWAADRVGDTFLD